jgi:hypothetical protein
MPPLPLLLEELSELLVFRLPLLEVKAQPKPPLL